MALSAEIASLFVSIGAKSTVSKDLDAAEQDITKKTTGLSKTAKAGMLGVSAGIAGIGASMAVALSSAADYESQMAEVFTLLPTLSKDARAEMSNDMLALSSTLGIATDELIPALYQAISAGVPPDNVVEFLTTAGNAAIGGVTDLETAVDGITSVTNAYGTEIISAAEASDLMFTAVKLGKTDFEQLSTSLYQVIPTAAALGVGFEDITASLAAMTAQGTPTRVATTQLRQALVEMSKEGSGASDAFKEAAGVGFADFIAQGGNLQDALVLMSQKAGESGLAINDLFGSVEAGNAVLALTSESGATAFTKALEEMGISSGAATEAAETMNETAARTMEQLKVEFGNLVTELGNEFMPVLKDDILPLIKNDLMPLFRDFLIPTIKTLFGAFGDLPGPIKLVIGVIGGIVGALGPLMLLLGPLMPIVTTILPIALTALTGPIGIVIFAIGLLIAAGTLLYDNWDAIMSGMSAVTDFVVGAIVGYFTNMWDQIKTVLDFAIAGFKVFQDAIGAVGEFVGGVFDGIVNTVKWAINLIIDGLNVMINGINMIHLDIPGWLGGGSIGFNLSTIPKLAEGGVLSSAGSVMVGEEGPEVLSLPAGASVTPLSGAGGDIIITGNTINVRNDRDIELVATRLYSMVERKNRARGI